jgi:TolB-like protein/Tfp pilus assembly protein PilF
MPSPSLLQRLKERKLVQWALAYLAGAWVLYEVVDTVGDRWSLPNVFFQGLAVALAIGFFVALVIAWYHGEKGRQRVSGPELLMVAALLVVAGVVLSFLGGSQGTGTMPSVREGDARPGIAVLPCENISPDPEDAYYAEGFHEEILLKLQKISSLRSVGRASVVWYEENPVPPTRMAEELGVGYVGECSVRKDEDRIRITFLLLDGGTGGQLWAEYYDRDLTAGNLFEIQSDIAQQVAHAMEAILDPEDEARIAARPTESTEAFNLYLRGRFSWNKRTEEGFLQAIEYFEQALEEDPTYALAYVGIADSYNFLGWQDLRPSDDVYPLAKAAAERALMIDGGLSEAHASLAYVKLLYDWDWSGAEQGFRRALELNPDNAEARQWYAEYLAYMGRHDESVAEARRARMLDPLSLGINHNLGLVLYEARQYDLAISEYQRLLRVDPDFVIAHNYLGLALAGKGMYDAALAEVRMALDLTEGPNALYLAALGFVYASVGRTDEAEGVLEQLLELSTHRYVAPVSIAIIYGTLGQLDRAFEWMEKGYEVRDDFMMVLKVSPRLDSLRSDPRFQSLLRRVGLAD